MQKTSAQSQQESQKNKSATCVVLKTILQKKEQRTTEHLSNHVTNNK